MSTTGTIFSGSSDAYDRFMGRYSRPLAADFTEFAGVRPGLRVLDVGAGTGALTQQIVHLVGEENVAAAEPSTDYVATLRERFPYADVRQAPAEGLPWDAGRFDAGLAQLVVVFMADAVAAFRELARVTRDGGIVATCMWEVEGMDMMRALGRVRERLRPGAFPRATHHRDEPSLRALFESVGLRDVETTTLEVAVDYATLDELWEPAIHVGGPGGPMVNALSAEELAAARRVFEEELGTPSGTFTLRGRAAAVRGIV